MYTYLWINILSVLFPVLLSFDKKVAFYKEFKYAFPAILITASLFCVWDYFFTAWGIWGFNDKYITGIWWFGLPMEEVLFFFTVPFACLFVYACTRVYFPKDFLSRSEHAISFILILLSIAGVILFRKQLYTSVTMLFCGMSLLIRVWAGKRKSLSRFYVGYAFCLLPFLIINSILTYLPVVWYNNAFNTGVRIFTIPVEDSFYLMVLLLWNVGIYETLKRRVLPTATEAPANDKLPGHE